MATSSPTRRLSKLDLPAFGLPAITTVKSLAQQRALPRRGLDRIEGSEHALRAAPAIAGADEKIDLLVRKVDRGLDVDPQIREQRLKLADARRELALHGAHGRARGRRGAGIDQIGDRLGLRDVDLAVQEGALAELARPRRAAAELERAPHQHVEHEDAAVALQLQHVLAGERSGRRKIQGEPSIDGLAVARRESSRAAPAARRGSSPSRSPRSAAPRDPTARTIPTAPRPGSAGDGDDGVGRVHGTSVRPACELGAPFGRFDLHDLVDAPLLHDGQHACWSASRAPSPRGTTPSCPS